MRQRPHCDVRLTSVVRPGDDLLAEVMIDSKSVTPVDYVRLTLLGVESGMIRQQAPATHTVLNLVAELSGKTQLGKGEKRKLSARFSIPKRVVPSYTGTRVDVRYSLNLRIGIPWWLDFNRTYDCPIRPPILRRGAPKPVATTTLRENEAFLEVSLDDQSFSPGDVLSGAFAIGNIDVAKVGGVDLSIVGYERVTSYGPMETYRFTAHQSAKSWTGREVPFRVNVPKQAAPTFETAVGALSWSFEAKLDAGRNTVRHVTPIRIAKFDVAQAVNSARPRIGADRWHRVWADAGGAHGLAIDPEFLVLSGNIAGSSVRVYIDESKGRVLAADIAWPRPLGIDLAVKEKGILDFGNLIDKEPFCDRYHSKCREPAQGRAALDGWVQAGLVVFEHAEMNDIRARVRAETAGHDQPWIGAFLTKVRGLAEALARAHPTIPPPASMAGSVQAWTRFAHASNGQLDLGDMSIREATYEAARLEIETHFLDGEEPTRTVARIAMDPPIERMIDPDDDASLAAAPPGTKEILATIRAASKKVTLERDAISFELAGGVQDPASLSDTLAAALALGQKLRGDRGIGPYR